MAEGKENKKISQFIRISAAFFAAAVCVIAAFFVCACSKRVDISFSTESLHMRVGERRDLFPYVVFSPSTAANKDFTLSADSDIVSVDGTAVIAVSDGEATVTARSSSGGEAAVRITIDYRAANEVLISAVGELVQNVSDASAATQIDLSAVFGDHVDPSTVASWSVNGAHAAVGNTYRFTPPSFGEFKITASVQDVCDSVDVKIYRETSAVASFVGELRQSNDFSPIRFSVRENIDTRNPMSVTQWTVNGAVAAETHDFEFVPPSSGTYEISVRVNGRVREFANGADSVTVIAVGDRIPSVSEIAFDDADGVFVKWRDGGHIRSISVTAPSGERTVYYRSDSLYSHRFMQGAFDATDIIDVCAEEGCEPSAYAVKLTADGQSAEYAFYQYPFEAKKYLEENVLCNNKFLSDDVQTREWVKELYACGRRMGKAYVARGFAAESAAETAKSAAKLYGMPCTRAEVVGSEITMYFGDYVNAPVKSSVRDRTRREYSSLPHVEYDAASRRNSAYRFAADRRAKKVSVSDSEQLLTAVLGGCAPMPTQTGAAAAVYAAARTALLNIIGADYTDRQKVHAMYDWLTWVCARPAVVDADGSCRFIEGVFGSRNIEATGAVTSEGAAKAFALMCGMEGIDTVICSRMSDGSAYFWNKVKLCEVWYNVDVYAGIAAPDGSTDGGFAPCSHKTLLLSDVQAAAYGLICADSPEATDDGGAYCLQKCTYGGEYFDAFVDLSEKDGYNTIKAAVFSSFDAQRRSEVSAIGIGGATSVAPSNYFGVEFALDERLSAAEVSAVKSAVLRAADEYAAQAIGTQFEVGTVKTYLTDGNKVLLVTALKPRGVV